MALTLGDPAGVGSAIVLKAAPDPETFRLCAWPYRTPASSG
jgi:4-hydroxy-L-threonine phosphate dehydrogenase PdxA